MPDMAKLAEIKTKPNQDSVDAFLDNIDEKKRQDSRIILHIIEKATNEKPVMWGSSMIGFGNVRYKSQATGRWVDWFRIGFSPRKANFSLHLMDLRPHAETMKMLGKYKTSPSSLYFAKIQD